ncbi:MAG: RIP metalloprotease RseP [Bacteroidia bacterium]|nr:RIP metalloprotease RseP [Bacteroidia bacterium]
MGIITQIAGLLLSLTILVILHEMGHFAFSRLFKTRIEKFYMFFNAWFSIIKFRNIGGRWIVSFFSKNKENNPDVYEKTEFGIGWIPLGGYVKISGMIDESLDTEQMKQPPQPWEFRFKPAWQRLLIMLGGVIVNFLLALGIYSMILYTWGKEYVPAGNARYGIVCDSLALEIGLKNGDKILSVDTFKIERFIDVSSHILIDNAKTIVVERKGEKITIPVPAGFSQKMISRKVSMLVDFSFPFVIDSVLPNNPAKEAGLKKNDIVLSVNNILTPSAYEFMTQLDKLKDKSANIEVRRNDSVQHFTLKVTSLGKIGVAYRQPGSFFETKRITYGFFASIPAGIGLGVETLVSYVKQMKYVFTREGAKQLGGFGTIGSIFPKSWNWAVFWNMTAFLSVILAFMNILPIPALDGGHVCFLLFEIITGRKPGDKFLEYAQIVGMVLLFSLLLFANFNDIIRWMHR